MSKSSRRARKKANKAKKPKPLFCDGCKRKVKDVEDHDTVWSRTNISWDGVVIVAWCPYCGSETCSSMI